MSNTTGFSKRNAFILSLIVFGLLFIGTFYDYQISMAIYNPDNWFGIFLAAYGQFPMFAGTSMIGVLLIYISEQKLNIKTIVSYLGGGLLIMFAVFMTAFDPFMYIPNMNTYVSGIISLLLNGVVNLWLITYVKYKSKREIIQFIKYISFVIIVQLVFINIFKELWSRPRMRMISVTPEATFQPWYTIGSEVKDNLISSGISTQEFKSFPSGHTASATLMIMFSVLPLMKYRDGRYTKEIFVFGVIFGLLTGVSRIILGAHFVTDITVGFAIGMIACFIGYNLFYRGEEVYE